MLLAEDLETNFEALKAELLEILGNSRLPQSLKHAEGVATWVKRLKPDADIAMEIASLGHDLDTCKEEWRVRKKDFHDERSFKQAHAQKSAELLEVLLVKYELGEEMIARIKHLVANHEYAVDEDSQILMQAEAISFFEYNLPIYYIQKGETRTQEKIRTMWSKLSGYQQSIVQQLVISYDRKLTDYSHIREENWNNLIRIIQEVILLPT
jgi:hypothetical protein